MKKYEKESPGRKRQREHGGKRDLHREKCWQGSFTVEAAAVLPLTVLVLAALIICTFYVHDRTVFQSMACEIAASGSNFITEKEGDQAMERAGKQVKGERFLGSRNLSKNISIGKKESNAVLSASYPVPGMVAKYFSGGSLSIRKSWNSKKQDPAKTIWLIRGAKRLLNGG